MCQNILCLEDRIARMDIYTPPQSRIDLEAFFAMRNILCLLCLCQTATALQSLVLRHHMSPVRPRLLSPRAQQGPLEDGFKGLMPLADNSEGNVEPELVARVQQEVRELMGVELEDLLNPSKVVNLEREKIVKEAELASCTDAEVRAELETRLEKIDGDLFREKRTVFQGWLKGLFISQSVISLVLSGYMVRPPATPPPHSLTIAPPSSPRPSQLQAFALSRSPTRHRLPTALRRRCSTPSRPSPSTSRSVRSASGPFGSSSSPRCARAARAAGQQGQSALAPSSPRDPPPLQKHTRLLPPGPERGGLAAWMPWRGSGGALVPAPRRRCRCV